jgi:hypothetical protein
MTQFWPDGPRLRYHLLLALGVLGGVPLHLLKPALNQSMAGR